MLSRSFVGLGLLLLSWTEGGVTWRVHSEYRDLPIKYSREEVAADHKALEDGTLMDSLRIPVETTPDYYEIPSANRRMVKIFPVLSHTEVKELKSQIEAMSPRFEEKAGLIRQELELLEHGLWVRCYWEFQVPPSMNDGYQCSASELQYLIDRL